MQSTTEFISVFRSLNPLRRLTFVSQLEQLKAFMLQANDKQRAEMNSFLNTEQTNNSKQYHYLKRAIEQEKKEIEKDLEKHLISINTKCRKIEIATFLTMDRKTNEINVNEDNLNKISENANRRIDQTISMTESYEFANLCEEAKAAHYMRALLKDKTPHQNENPILATTRKIIDASTYFDTKKVKVADKKGKNITIVEKGKETENLPLSALFKRSAIAHTPTKIARFFKNVGKIIGSLGLVAIKSKIMRRHFGFYKPKSYDVANKFERIKKKLGG